MTKPGDQSHDDRMYELEVRRVAAQERANEIAARHEKIALEAQRLGRSDGGSLSQEQLNRALADAAVSPGTIRHFVYVVLDFQVNERFFLQPQGSGVPWLSSYEVPARGAFQVIETQAKKASLSYPAGWRVVRPVGGFQARDSFQKKLFDDRMRATGKLKPSPLDLMREGLAKQVGQPLPQNSREQDTVARCLDELRFFWTAASVSFAQLSKIGVPGNRVQDIRGGFPVAIVESLEEAIAMGDAAFDLPAKTWEELGLAVADEEAIERLNAEARAQALADAGLA